MMFDDESEPKKTEIEPQLAIFTMTTFDYNYQNSFRFCFLIEISQSL